MAEACSRDCCSRFVFGSDCACQNFENAINMPSSFGIILADCDFTAGS